MKVQYIVFQGKITGLDKVKDQTLVEEATVKQERYSHSKRKGEDGSNPSTLYTVKPPHDGGKEFLLTLLPDCKSSQGLCTL